MEDGGKACMDLEKQKQEEKQGGWREFLRFIGPGFLVSLAYLDPGNLQTDLQAGANYGYELLWVILLGLVFALVIQSLAANLGVCTGKHLSEVCKVEYPGIVNYTLWLLAEIAVISADIPEVIGTAFALKLLCHIPVWIGVLCTGISTLVLIGLQNFGIRKLEFLITFLVFVMAACFFGELHYVKPPAKAVFQGMFVPRLSGNGATGDAIALLGALIMPHNLFLHSALVLSRKIPKSTRDINDACRYFLIESGLALFVAFLINVAVVSVAGTVCLRKDLSPDEIQSCGDLTLDSSSFLLKNVLGKTSSVLFGIALLASGQSSSITGTYAGQYIMEGFLDLRLKLWIRNIITRCIAIVPSLVISVIAGPSGAAHLISIASMILSFEIPFAVIPLLKFSGSPAKMGKHKNSKLVMIISWILGIGIMGINIYYLITSFVDWLFHGNSLPKAGKILVGVAVFPCMAFYIIVVTYLIYRKDNNVIHGESTTTTITTIDQH